MNLRSFSDPNLSHRVIALYESEHPRPAIGPEVEVTYLFFEGDSPSRLDIYRALVREVRSNRPDLIHSSLADAAFASRLVGASLGISVLESLVNISHDRVRLVDNPHVTRLKLAGHTIVDRITMTHVSHFHALTSAVAQSWVRYAHIRPERITVIPRGVDLKRFDVESRSEVRLEVRKEFGLVESTPVIVNVARQEPQKGQRYLLEAMPSVLSRHPDCVLLIAGRDGNSSAQLRATASALAIEQSVFFLGVRDDVARLLLAADVFAFPSLFEGLGVSLLEAMASGCACVVSDVPPFDEIVEQDVSAIMVPPRDPEALVEALSRVLSNRHLREQLGRSARLTVRDRFGIAETSRRMEMLYRYLGTTH